MNLSRDPIRRRLRGDGPAPLLAHLDVGDHIGAGQPGGWCFDGDEESPAPFERPAEGVEVVRLRAEVASELAGRLHVGDGQVEDGGDLSSRTSSVRESA